MTIDASPLTAAASDVQQGVWFLTRLRPDAPPAVARHSYWVSGPLDVDTLGALWRVVLERHAVLRMTVASVDGTPRPRVGPAHRDAFDVRRVGQGTPAVLPGSLDRGPLARLVVHRITSRHHRVDLVAHRAVADDVSLTLVAQELSARYAEAIGAPAPPPIPGRLAEHPQPGGADVPERSAVEPWSTASAVSLPVGRDVPGTPAALDEIVFDWGSEAHRRVRALARAEGTRPATIVLAALQIVLARHGRDDTGTVGLPVSLRGPGEESTVGPLSTVVPVVGGPTADTTFRQHLRRTVRRCPRPATTDPLGGPRLDPFSLAERNPPYDAVLAVAERTDAPLQLAGAAVRELATPRGTLLAHLTLTVATGGPTLGGALAFRTDRLERRTASGLLGHLHTLLVAAVGDPDRTLADLPLETPAQLADAARAGDATAHGPQPRPVPELVAECAERFPHALAVRDEVEPLTYAELVTRATGLAAWLQARAAVAQRAVAIRLSMGSTLVAASLAVLQAGGHLVWLSPRDQGQRARTVLRDLRPAVLLVTGDPDDDPTARWYRDEEGGQVLALAAEPPEGSTATRPTDPAGAAYVAFTSGSTGRPKGVRQTHAALAQFATWLAHVGGLRPGARVAQWAAVEHDPSLCEVFATLVAGATLVPVPDRVRIHPERFVRWLEREGVTFLQTVPSFARELVAALERRGAPPHRLAHLVLMGETLGVDLANRLRDLLPHARLWNVYGPTETVAATAYQILAPVAGERTPIGQAIPGRQILVVDGQDRLCPAGVTGEIVVRSPFAVSGYLPVAGGHGPEGAPFRPLRAVAPAAVTDARCYRTGDLGRRRFDGVLEHVGRVDQQVKLAGHRLELTAVEAALAELPSVADCAATAVTDPDGLVSRLAVFVAPRGRGDRATLVASLRARLRHRCGPVLHRTTFALLDRIPRNVGGKVDRARLPDPTRMVDAAARLTPDPVECAVEEMWAALLPAPPADRHQEFSAAGGHSLLLARLAHLCTARFGVDVALAELLAAPTVAGMAAAVRSAVDANGDPTVGGSLGATGQPRRWEEDHGSD
ncbi:AMP-binding protein [Micromonospora sp. KLBMP9576]|uniref:AMP-binding protein n=1 Tax=Micromonospora sp. KLBMP9576 TaxID=3424769 RepID=UPI003D92E893